MVAFKILTCSINADYLYRYGVTAALLATIFLILVIYLMGLFCGTFGYSSKALPYERSCVSHCGAILLLM